MVVEVLSMLNKWRAGQIQKAWFWIIRCSVFYLGSSDKGRCSFVNMYRRKIVVSLVGRRAAAT